MKLNSLSSQTLRACVCACAPQYRAEICGQGNASWRAARPLKPCSSLSGKSSGCIPERLIITNWRNSSLQMCFHPPTPHTQKKNPPFILSSCSPFRPLLSATHPSYSTVALETDRAMKERRIIAGA